MNQNNEIINFEFSGHAVRVVDITGDPWFVGNDIAEILGYSRPRDAIAAHCKGAAKHRILTDGGLQEVSIIPERDVYRLIMRSNMPAAEKFEEWVVGDVLPSIRKNGGYIAGQENETDPAVIIARALKVADNVIAEKDRELLAARSELAAAQPAISFVENYVEARSTKSLREAAKVLGQRERDFISWLASKRIIFKQAGNWYPHAEYQHRGYFEVKTGESNGHAYSQTRFTPAGIAWIAKRLDQLGAA